MCINTCTIKVGDTLLVLYEPSLFLWSAFLLQLGCVISTLCVLASKIAIYIDSWVVGCLIVVSCVVKLRIKIPLDVGLDKSLQVLCVEHLLL